MVEAWQAAAAVLGAAVRDGWLCRNALSCRSFSGDERACENACADLLKTLLEGAPAGVGLSQPWTQFIGTLRPPDHAALRVPSNIERYAGNYVNIVFGSSVLGIFLARPLTA
eukprot:CAMPEP_0180656176 /NCGR_PEP_ID=MMETSP1037_2-20121125/55700_1 /TAXON_ID=632150 /ORGANISM="Azadinium spinosum, Strain 3D9" /LENGTH=111 /DNA_ID=CAMNT_0022682717 /DNA_START=1 /DNA_END=332 /DNA_ORIENTATION=-